jgi:hypothetical protein
MAVSRPPERSGGYVSRPQPSGLADVLDLILDKGLVIDAYVRVSLIGIEILTIDARIVIASVDTYLRFAEAVNRMDLQNTETSGLPELMEDITSSGAESKTKGALEGAKDKFDELFGDDDEDEDQDQDGDREKRDRDGGKRKQPARRRRRSSRDEDDE